MVYSNNFSDYGSGNTSNDSSMSFGGPDKWPTYQPRQQAAKKQKSSSYVDLVMGRCTIEDVMQEFRMNGSDSPYSPDEERAASHRADELIGMGPSGAYLRQKSWPEPDRTPAVRLPRPAAEWLPPTETFTTSTPVEESPAPNPEALTSEQLRVLASLPNSVLYSLLRELEQGRGEDTRVRPKRHPEECRFCKNNGERESYYRSHALKDAGGRVRCPVLRAFVCKRCGASGDSAHTIKYCPLSTNEERIKSAAMMRSVRLASGRRRAPAQPAAPRADYVIYDAAPYAIQDSDIFAQYGEATPLDPDWAALEQKLRLRC